MELKWNLSDLGRFLKECVSAVLKGNFLVKIKCSEYFIHIIWTFFLAFCFIWITMMTEKTLTTVEQNKKTLSDMQIYHAQKTVEKVSLGRMTTIEQMLAEQGSKLQMPQTPPRKVESGKK